MERPEATRWLAGIEGCEEWIWEFKGKMSSAERSRREKGAHRKAQKLLFKTSTLTITCTALTAAGIPKPDCTGPGSPQATEDTMCGFNVGLLRLRTTATCGSSDTC